jgi:lipopolysaccharide export system permease protein
MVFRLMDGITKYVFRQVGTVMFFITLCLTLAIWLTQSLRFVDLIVNRGLPVVEFLYLSMLLLPRFLVVVLPVALFASVLFTYNRLTMDSELIVCRAVGFSQAALARPALLLAGVVMLVLYTMNLYFLPASYAAFKDLQWAIRNEYSNILLQEGAFNEVAPNVVVYVRHREGDGDLRGIMVHDMRRADAPVTLMAETGALIRTEAGPRVMLVNGNRQVVDRGTKRLSLLYFDRYTVEINAERAQAENRWHEPRERFLGELFFPDDSPADRRYRLQIIAEGHNRLSSPLLALAFTMVAVAALLHGDFNRRGQSARILIACVVVIALQASAMGIVSLGARSTSAHVAMYLLPIATVAASLWVMVHRRRRPAAPAAAMAAE